MTEEISMKEKLIQAGIDELSHYGIKSFSVRRVAAKCGVSCAAPYKHFKNKKEFLIDIIEYIQQIWEERQQKILQAERGDLRSQILQICMEYACFLVENPHFRSVIMLKDSELDVDFAELKKQITKKSRELVGRYCESVGMPEETKNFKVFVVRSLMYGASLMMDNSLPEEREEILNMMVRAISREFDIL